MNGDLVILDEISLPVPNLPLLRKTLEYLEEHPNQHDQYSWGTTIKVEDALAEKCGTAMCISGWAQILNGADVVGNSFEGMTALGLTYQEAEDLFERTIFVNLDRPKGGLASRSQIRANIQAVAERIAERAGERL